MQYVATLTQSRDASSVLHASTESAHRAICARQRDVGAVFRAAGIAAIVLLLLATAAVTVLTLVTRPGAPEPDSWTSVSVGLTDSVWSVATAHPIEGYSTATTVELICAQNNLASATVHPGQVLLVPDVSDPQTALAQR